MNTVKHEINFKSEIEAWDFFFRSVAVNPRFEVHSPMHRRPDMYCDAYWTVVIEEEA